jgi:alpha-mannosidase
LFRDGKTVRSIGDKKKEGEHEIMSTIHIITHTHWDREWFLTSEYTNEWLDDLFENLFTLIEQVSDYRYILDGQTLMIEDYVKQHPEKRTLLQQKAQAGNFLIGPYYGQIDWRVASEESLMRNIYLGITDAHQYGNLMSFGWLMDNFGHCSQSPQIHKLFGIDTVFVWRGPVFEHDHITSDFIWEGSDGSSVDGTYLMSGYRNFYNLTDTIPYLQLRIEQLKNILEPFSPHKHVIFLNGYDLDVFPEDPFQFLQHRKGLIRSTPEIYTKECKLQVAHEHNTFYTPVLRGELYSGKYACVFPGTLSTRSYLKIENALIEHLMAFYLEPLQAIVNTAANEDIDSAETESLWRELLKTQLHDNIGGVGVDQVHDNMENVYYTLYFRIRSLIGHYLEYLPPLLDLQPGTYIFMPSPFAYENMWLKGDEKNYSISANGSGVYKIQQEEQVLPLEKPVDTYTWENEYYTFDICKISPGPPLKKGGTCRELQNGGICPAKEGIWLNGNSVGELSLEQDEGDTYNADIEQFPTIPEAKITTLKIQKEHKEFARITLEREISHEGILIQTHEEIFMNTTPLISWNVSVISTGKNYRLRFAYDTQDTHSRVFAKMPYDIYERLRKDDNYFGQEIPTELQPVLLAAREIGSVSDFPFQGFVALSDTHTTKAVFARGLREYEVDENGKIFVTLKRSVEWITKSIRTRIGDAGPKMYVPSAKDERTTRFELALVNVDSDVHSVEFLKWFYLFDYGYLLFDNATFEGKSASAKFWDEPLPWSGIHAIKPGKSVIRVYNPYDREYAFSKPYLSTDPFGKRKEEQVTIAEKKIEHLIYKFEKNDSISSPQNTVEQATSSIEMLNFPDWPVGEDKSTIDTQILSTLKKEVTTLREEKRAAEQSLQQFLQKKSGPAVPELSKDQELAYHKTKHTDLRLQREILELELSILLNELKDQEHTGELQETIRDIGKQLNLSRRHRRTYDYILSLFTHTS